MNVWAAKVLPWAAFSVMDAVPASLVVGVSTAMAEPARPNVDRLAAAAHIAARRLTLIWETMESLLSFLTMATSGRSRFATFPYAGNGIIAPYASHRFRHRTIGGLYGDG